MRPPRVSAISLKAPGLLVEIRNGRHAPFARQTSRLNRKTRVAESGTVPECAGHMPIGPRIREGGWLRNGKSNQLAARCALHPVNDAFDVGFETEFPNFASICGRAEFRGRERSRSNRRRMCGSAALKAFNSLHQVLDLASARARSSSRLRLRLHLRYSSGLGFFRVCRTGRSEEIGRTACRESGCTSV